MQNKYTVSEIRILSLAAGSPFFSRANMRGDGGQVADRVSDFKIEYYDGRPVLCYRKTIRNQFKRDLAWLFNEKTHRLSPFQG